MKSITLIVALAGLAPLAHPFVQRLTAEINTVAFDSFETYDNTTHLTLSVLGGAAMYSTNLPGAVAYVVVNQAEEPPYSLGAFGSGSPRTGDQYAGTFVGPTETVSLTFASPVFGFGGYYQFDDLRVLRTRFFDEWGEEISPGTSSEYTERSNGERFFLGWYSEAALIKRIDFIGVYSEVAGFVGHEHAVDDIMIFDSVPEPGTLVALGLGAAALLQRRKR